MGCLSSYFQVAVYKQNCSCVHSRIALGCSVADGTYMKLLERPEPQGNGHQQPNSVTLAVFKPHRLVHIHTREYWLKTLLMKEAFSSRKC